MPLSGKFFKQASDCSADIKRICADIANQLGDNDDISNVAQLLNHLSHATLFSPALDNVFADIATDNTQPLPTPATRQKTLELLTLYLVIKHFASRLHEQNKSFYALCLANKALEILGGAKYLYGLSQDTILKINLLSDNDKESIHKQMQREQGKAHALKATESQRQERARLGRKYLQIMQDKGFSSWASAAEYIYIHENQEYKRYRWILSALTEADKARMQTKQE